MADVAGISTEPLNEIDGTGPTSWWRFRGCTTWSSDVIFHKRACLDAGFEEFWLVDPRHIECAVKGLEFFREQNI